MNIDAISWDRIVEKHCLRAVILILVLHAFMIGWSATWQSPTLNEPGHLASGIAIWEMGRFDTYRVNPPLVRSVAALPVMMMSYKTNWNRLTYGTGIRCEFNIGMDFVEANGINSIWLFNVARWACIPFSILGGWFCYLWGRDLCGKLSGMFACALWCSNPNVIAYGQVITPDMGGASIELMASYFFWQWLKQTSWRHATSAGIFLGIALLAKSTWVLLFAVWPSLWIVLIAFGLKTSKAATSIYVQALQLILMFVIALYLLNLGYVFNGTMTPLGDFQFVSKTLGNPGANENYGNVFAGSLMGRVPIPLPKEFVLGVDHQRSDFENFPIPSYLRGEWRKSSWWYYYVYGFLVKMPVGLICLVLIAAIGSAMRFMRSKIPDSAGWATLCVPGVLTVVVVSCQPTLNHHFRYVLPAFGPLFVFAGAIPFFFHSCKIRMRTVIFSISVISAMSSICSTFSCAPRFISYFNELAGGARNGHHHMLHSNLDWGQDLYFLRDWLKERKPQSPIRLAYYGLLDPKALGIDYIPPSCGPIRNTTPSSHDGDSGLYAVSINYVMGDRSYLNSDCDYQFLRNKTPIHICGDTIYIYELH